MTTIKQLINAAHWNSNRRLTAVLKVGGEKVAQGLAHIEPNGQGSFWPEGHGLADLYEVAELVVRDFSMEPTIDETLSISNARECIAKDPHHWHFHVEWPLQVTLTGSAATP